MAITIMPTPFASHSWLAGDHLRVIGDVEATLIIPAARPQDLGEGQTLVESYYIGVSDGTLIRATNDSDRPDFVVILAGAAEALIAGDGMSISIPATVTWVTVSSNSCGHAVAEAAWDTAPLFA